MTVYLWENSWVSIIKVYSQTGFVISHVLPSIVTFTEPTGMEISHLSMGPFFHNSGKQYAYKNAAPTKVREAGKKSSWELKLSISFLASTSVPLQ